jgi:protein gp37
MGKYSKIGWTTHTFNPWWGCQKVSPACEFCYAQTWAKRTGHDVWGGEALRRFFGEPHWREPLKWNAEAIEAGEHPRVFCASMADVFEDRPDLEASRNRLWDLIEKTDQLRWLLLTKRPENIGRRCRWAGGPWPENVWLGTTVESQRWAERRLPHLLAHAAPVRFISAEPLLGPLDLSPFPGIGWIIAGGESGAKARPTHPRWLRDLGLYAAFNGIPFFFKQWGRWAPVGTVAQPGRREVMEIISERERAKMIALGTALAGRTLYGCHFDEIPPH